MKTSDPKIIVALDYSDAKDVIRFADSVTPSLCRLKVGKELFTHAGPEVVSDLIKKGFDIFLDLKFYDIPNTVSGAIGVAADMVKNGYLPEVIQAIANANLILNEETILG